MHKDIKGNEVHEDSILELNNDFLQVKKERNDYFCYPLVNDRDISGLELKEVLEEGYIVRKLKAK